jgi:hypothetical protein
VTPVVAPRVILCTIGRLNESWLKMRASGPSSGASVQSSSKSSQWIGAAGGRSPSRNGARYRHSMIDVVWSSPLGRKR